LAEGKNIEEILEELGEVAEGVPTAKALYKISKNQNLYLPIANEVYKMIVEDKSPLLSVGDLLEWDNYLIIIFYKKIPDR